MKISTYAGIVGALTLGLIQVAGAQGTPPGLAVATSHVPVCPSGNPHDTARCHACVVTDSKGAPQINTTPSGYGPAASSGSRRKAS